MSKLFREHDELMIRVRSQFKQLGWFSRLFFPSEMERFLLQFFVSKMHRAESYKEYEAQYSADAAFGFCKSYHHFITDNSLFGRFRHWLLDFLPAFNNTKLMDMWRFTNEQGLGKDEFGVLVANPDAAVAAFQRDILVFKQALANDESQTLRQVYAKYLWDITIQSPMSSSLEGFASLLIVSCNKGLVYDKADYGNGDDKRKKMFDVLRDNLPAFTGIAASLQKLNARIHFANLITVQQVVTLFQDDRLDKWVNGVNALHLQTINPATNRTALHENPDLITFLLKHPEPENLSQGLVVLRQLGLCIKTNLLKKGVARINLLERLEIQERVAFHTANRLMTNIGFYTRGNMTEAAVKRAFEQNMSEELEFSSKVLENDKKFHAKYDKFNRLTRKHHLPTALQMSDFETTGLNVLRLAHHPYPERVVNALSKFRFRDADTYADERACVEGSANGWGFALGDMSFDFFNYVKSKGLHVIYHLLLDYSHIFLHEDVMLYWEKIQNNHLSPVHFFNIYQLCIHGLSEGAAQEGQAIARKGVIDYLQNISDKQNNYSLMTETALILMFIHGGKILDEKLDDVIADLMTGVWNKTSKSIDCINRLNREQFVDSETDISAPQLLALTWIALQKVFAKKETTTLKPSTLMDIQLSAFQDAHTAARFTDKRSTPSEVSTSYVRPGLL